MRALVASFFLVASTALAQDAPPLRIIGNIYYVGANEVTSFLIATPKGHVLIDGGFKETAPMIERNIEKLGFQLNDVKVLLNSHAHLDHAGGLAELKRVTGAKLYASGPDTPLLARGGLDDPQFGNRLPFPPVEPDHIVADGERVTIDGAMLTAHITAGHTPGCTTWTMNVRDGATTRHVVFFCSPSVPQEYRLVNNPRYPAIAEDYRKEFATLKSLPCDVPLGSHGSFFDLEGKRNRLVTGARPNPFLDPKGCADLISLFEKRFEETLARQKQ